MQKQNLVSKKVWEKPQFIDIRLGFEITMYVNVRK